MRVRRQPERSRIADRLERAIEDHADVEQEIERGERARPSRTRLRRTVFWIVLTGASLYLVAPSVLEVAGSWQNLEQISPAWFPAMAALQAAALACMWALQRLALHTQRWRPVIASQLAGNALSKVAPGGGAVGAALQYRMLVQAGLAPARTVAGLTASNLLTFAVVLALPVLAVPAIVRGVVPRSLLEAAIAGVVLFAILFALGALMLTRDDALRWVGTILAGRAQPSASPLGEAHRPAAAARGRARPHPAHDRTALEARLGLDHRALGVRLCDVARRACGGWLDAAATLVLLAFCAAQLLAQVPVTPGGLGFVEAGLTATLALAGVATGDAVLATLAYRLFSYWLPLPLGLVGVALHQRTSGEPGSSS